MSLHPVQLAALVVEVKVPRVFLPPHPCPSSAHVSVLQGLGSPGGNAFLHYGQERLWRFPKEAQDTAASGPVAGRQAPGALSKDSEAPVPAGEVACPGGLQVGCVCLLSLPTPESADKL